MIRSTQSNKDPFFLPSVGFGFLFCRVLKVFVFFSHIACFFCQQLLHFFFFHLLLPTLLSVHVVIAPVGITESHDIVMASFLNSELDDTIFDFSGKKALGIDISYPKSKGGGCSVAMTGNLKKESTGWKL